MNPTDARALALAVARDVMGWPVVEYSEAVRTSPTVVKRLPTVGRLDLWQNTVGGWEKETWDPACNVTQALEVLDHARKGQPFMVYSPTSAPDVYGCRIGMGVLAEGPTIAEAICRAVLALVGGGT